MKSAPRPAVLAFRASLLVGIAAALAVALPASAGAMGVWEAEDRNFVEIGNDDLPPMYDVAWTTPALFDNFNSLSSTDYILIDDWPMLMSETTQDGFVPLPPICEIAGDEDEDIDEAVDEGVDEFPDEAVDGGPDEALDEASGPMAPGRTVTLRGLNRRLEGRAPGLLGLTAAKADEAVDEASDEAPDVPVVECIPGTTDFWLQWPNQFHPGDDDADLYTMSFYVSEVNRNSALFGPGELFGELTLTTLDAILGSVSTDPVDIVKKSLVASWLNLVTGRIAFPQAVDLDEVTGGSTLLGQSVMPVFDYPVPPLFPRGGVMGAVEDVIQSAPGPLALRTANAILDAVNDGTALIDAFAISPLNRFASLYGESTSRTYLSYAEGRSLPPWNVRDWYCTEGSDLSQYVIGDQHFHLTGETAPEALRQIYRDAEFEIYTLVRVDSSNPIFIPPLKTVGEEVELTHGPIRQAVTIDYTGTTTNAEQVLRFVDALNTAGTGIAFRQQVDRVPFGPTDWIDYMRVHGSAPEVFTLKNRVSDPAGAYFPTSYPSTDIVAAGRGVPIQEGVWAYLDTHTSLVVGKTPLWTDADVIPVTLKVTNIGQLPSPDSVLTDLAPPGFDPESFSVAPVSITRQGTFLKIAWAIPALGGSLADGIHPSLSLTYTLVRRVVTPPVRVPGPEVSFGDEVSHGAYTIIE